MVHQKGKRAPGEPLQPAALFAHCIAAVLQKVVMQRFGLGGGDGTRFYEFGSPTEVERLRQDFRAGLARVPASAADAEEIVAEARWAFGMHKTLFVELQARHGGATPA